MVQMRTTRQRNAAQASKTCSRHVEIDVGGYPASKMPRQVQIGGPNLGATTLSHTISHTPGRPVAGLDPRNCYKNECFFAYVGCRCSHYGGL